MDNVVNMNKMPVKKVARFVVIGIVVILALLILSSIFYTVNDRQQAIVLTFGKVTAVMNAGMHTKLPAPIQKVILVDVYKTQRMEFGYRETGPNQYSVVTEESKMITGDFNIINIDLFVEWKISDPVKYTFYTEKPVDILRNALSNSLRSTIGTTPIDNALTSGKVEIQDQVRQKLDENLSYYDLGIQVLEVKIQDSDAPTDEVKKAFQNVENAKQEKEKAINNALTYQNSELPKARAQADRIVREAESAKEARINEAKGQVARFLKIFNEYQSYKSITKTRMYLEVMEEVLPGIEVYIMDDSGSTQKLLPVKSFGTEEAKK